jgi:Trypsin-like peptidase domain
VTAGWTDAVITVGAGRGFLIEHENRRLVITAAHCLPRVPEPHPARYTEESTFAQLLGPLGEPPTVWAECVFLEVMADLAVLGAPDTQVLWDEYDAYVAFTEDRPVLPLGDIPQSPLGYHPLATHPIHVLTLDGQWVRGQGNHLGGPIMLDGVPIESGMSGSPILNDRGHAIGLVSTGPINPRLARDLPAWLAPQPRRQRASVSRPAGDRAGRANPARRQA